MRWRIRPTTVSLGYAGLPTTPVQLAVFNSKHLGRLCLTPRSPFRQSLWILYLCGSRSLVGPEREEPVYDNELASQRRFAEIMLRIFDYYALEAKFCFSKERDSSGYWYI